MNRSSKQKRNNNRGNTIIETVIHLTYSSSNSPILSNMIYTTLRAIVIETMISTSTSTSTSKQ